MIDAHLHFQFPVFDEKRAEIIEELQKIGVRRLGVNATEPDDWESVGRLAEQYPEVVPFFGVHPWKVDSAFGDWKTKLREYLERFPGAGIGETGLDKWIRNADIDTQKVIFRDHLELAEETDRPVAVHCLQAWGHLLECLEETRFSGRFLLHSYSGPYEMVAPILDRGSFFSLSGYFFRPDKAEKLDRFSSIPIDRILLETDAPDMDLPEDLDHYGWKESGNRVNHPGNISTVYEQFAKWKKIDPLELNDQIKQNFERFLRGEN